MARVVEENGLTCGGEEVYTEDGTVDLKSRPVLRSKTGGWKACSFIVVYEIFEKIAYQGIRANLVVYLTKVLQQGTVKASNNVTNWTGTIMMTPILGAYIADARLGRFWTFLIGSAIYTTGMVLLSLAASVRGLKPPSCTSTHVVNEESCPKASSLQLGIFYLALYVIAVGGGGTKANISTFGADQFDEFEPKEKKQKLSFFNWWVFSLFLGFLISQTFLVYIQDNVGWTLGYSLPTAGLALGLLVFLVGVPFYRHRLPLGSPFTKMARVFVAAFRKWNMPLPDDPRELYELSLEEYAKTGTHIINPTPNLRFLNKAAVKCQPKNTPWTLCPATQVEGTKQIVKLLPIFMATFVPEIISAQSHTLFIKQGTTLERSLGPHFNIPPAGLTAFVTIFMLVTIVIYDRCFVPIVRRYTENPRGISMLQRFGIGLVLHIAVTVTACLAERKRLSVARGHGVVGKKETVPLTVFVLLPQFALLGIADAFLEVSKLEFFYDQAPQGMKSLGSSFSITSRGVGNFLSTAVLTSVSEITKRHVHKGWVLDDLNVSHLDYFYAFLAVLAFLNLLYFFVVANLFVYNAEIKKSKLDSATHDTFQN